MISRFKCCKMAQRTLCIGISLLFSMPLPTLAGKETPQPLTGSEIKSISPFATALKRNWNSWAQGVATLGKYDLIAKMASPEYRGEDAAALVTLELYQKKRPPIDLASALAIDDTKIIERYYRDVLKLKRAKRVLFANGRPTFELLQQGPAGDCYFFSASGWMTRFRPADVMNAITVVDDGRYRVRFANGDEATVTTPTDAELAVNDSESTLQDGLWMSILEKATGTIQARTYSRSAAIADPTVAIDTPGIPIASVIKRWTGRDVDSFHLGKRAHREKVRNALSRMQERRSLATALLLHKPPAKLAYDHVYAIMGFNPETDIVTIWNPWGTDFTPPGPDGPYNGYARKHGIFNLPLDDFINFYSFLAIERN